MFQRISAVFTAAIALLLLLPVTPAAAAQPPGTPSATLPAGFPDDLKKFVGSTPEFRSAEWWTKGRCAGHGGDFALYLQEVMKVEPRLLYWSTPPEKRKALWLATLLKESGSLGDLDWSKADPNKEPPILPRTYPLTNEEIKDAFPRDIDGPCVDQFKEWANPANNAWGFTWLERPDPESLRLMKAETGGYVHPPSEEVLANPCADRSSTFCQRAFFVDCTRVKTTNPYVNDLCHGWNIKIAELFADMTHFIESNTSFLDEVGDFFEAVGDVLWTAGKIIVQAFIAIGEFIYDVVKFIMNPGDAIDDLANALHRAAVDFTTKVLQGLATIGNFDPSAPWFLATYAASTGIGLVLMAFMAILMIMRTASGGGGREDLQQALFKYLPLGVFLAVFAPAIAAVLGEAMNGVTMGIASWDAGYMTAAANKIGLLGSVTAGLIPGGAIIGILLFLFMVIGAFMVFVGLAMQSIALPMAGAVAGIAWGMWVHPKWRRKALKVPFMYLGVLASKPLLFFLLGVIFALIDGNLSEPAMKTGGIALLTQIVLVVVALIVAGFAPFSLLRYAPILPTAAESHDSQPGSGFGTAAVVGAGVGALAERQRHRGGGGTAAGQPAGGGPGGGGPSIQQAYADQQQGKPRNQQPQPRTASPVAGTAGAGTGGPGAPNTGGPGAPHAGGRQQAAAAAASTGGAPQGTTAGAAASGERSGAAAGGWAVAAQVGVAGFNKTRQAAHTRHAPDVDDEVVRGDGGEER